ncbi:MAG TPA: hypothetical protein PKD29_02125 [Rhodocyclaceae bacterium]|nr:hypothetical protein [Rhodocyclaceae bacterium]
MAGAGGIVGAGGAVAVAKDSSRTSAYIGAGSEIQRAATAHVSATTNRRARAESVGTTVGGLSIGASVARATFTGGTTAYLGDGVLVGKTVGKTVDGLLISASDISTASTRAVAGSAGIYSGAGADAGSSIATDVSAYLGAGGDVTARDTVSVTAQAAPAVDATAVGVSAGAAAVGVSLASATLTGNVLAFVGENSRVGAGQVAVTARTDLPAGGTSAYAESIGAGGGLIGASGSESTASYAGTTKSYIGGASTIAGRTEVIAETDTRQEASATGVAVGFLAAGANIAGATSLSDTQAYVGSDVAVSGAGLTVRAGGTDDNFADATAGTGGVVSGAASKATTTGHSTTQASIGAGDATRNILVDALAITADHTHRFNTQVDSVNASVVGASGAYGVNAVTSAVSAEIGDGAYVLGNSVVVQANNRVDKPWLGGGAYNIRSGSGGVVDAAAGKSESRMALDTTARVGDDARVHVLAPASGSGVFTMDALNDVSAMDQVKLDSGGAIAVAKAVSHLYVDRANATVAFGANSRVINDLGDINAGARSRIALDSRAAADAYGLAGAPSGEAYAYYTGLNLADVAPGASLSAAEGQVFLAGGQSSSGTPTSINANSNVNLWNKTAFPIDTDPDARSNISNNATVRVQAGAVVEGAGDLSLLADRGSVTANAVGIGKDIYRETAGAVASGISNLFGGGDVSFDIKGGTTSVGGLALAQVDGIARTGIDRLASLTLNYALDTTCGAAVCYDSAGNVRWNLLPTATKGVTYSRDLAVGIAASIQERIDKLRQLKAQYAGDPVASAAYDSEIKYLQYKLVQLGLAATDASGNWISGKFSSPSPRQAAQDQIGGQQSIVNGYVATADTAATSAHSDIGSASSSQTTLQSNAGTVVSDNSTTGTYNNAIIVDIQGLSGYAGISGANKTNYDNLVAKVGDNSTRGTTINTLKGLNATDQATVDGKNADIDTKLGEISTRKNQIGNLVSQVVQGASTSAATQIVTLQAEIDTRQAEINTLASEAKSLLTTIAGRNDTIKSNAAAIDGNNSTIESLQTSLATALGTAPADAAKLADITRLKGLNSTLYGGVTTASGNIGTATSGVSTALTNVGTDQTAIDGAVNATARATASGLVSSLATSLPTLSTVAASGATADFVKVDDITVRLGSIRMKGDRLAGSGELRAPGDAQINITNNTPSFLVVNNLTIDANEGGTIRFNDILVNGNAEINRVNGGGTAANFATLLTRDSTGSGAPPPAINITSNYDPNSPVFKKLPAPAPDIQLNGNILNLRGSVNVLSKAGSILSNGSINAGTVNIKAENGDFVQSYVDGFDHVGGDPASIRDFGTPLGQGIIANGGVFISARFLNINSLVQSGIEQWTLTLPSSPTLTGPADLFGISQSAVDTALNNYKNATGPRYTYFTTAAGTVTYDAAANRLEASLAYADADRLSADWTTRSASYNGLYPLVSDYGNVGAYYDPTNVRYELNGTQVRGGYIQLFGQIINTGDPGGANSGRLRVLDGYGQIKITNPTGLPVVINNLDAGTDPTGTLRGTQGKIDITDIQSVDPVAHTSNVIHSVYTRDYSVSTGAASIKLLQETGRLEKDGSFTILGSSSGTDAGATDGRTTAYNPQTGLRYVWTTGTDNSSYTYWQFSGTQFLGIESLRTRPTGSVESQSGPFTRASYRLDDGTYLTKDTGSTGTRYLSSTVTRTTSDYWEKTAEWTNCNWWTLCIAQDYHSKWTETTGSTSITTKSLKADYPIAIEFSGYDRGAVTVNSAANVLLNGAVRNASGTTTITAGIGGPEGVTPLPGVSLAGRSIIQNSDDALIQSKDLKLAASGSIGAVPGASDARPVRVAATGTLDATADNGNVMVSQTLGNLNVGTVSAGGNAALGTSRVILSADGSILAAAAGSLIQGDRVELTSQNGAIGSIAVPLAVNVGEPGDVAQRSLYGLKASAAGDIGIGIGTWAHNAGGNLLADTIVSQGGDVKLVAPGRIIDNNPVESINKETWAQLLAYWDSLGLRAGTSANAEKQAQAVKSFEDGRTQDYALYWQIRQRQTDPATYDPAFTYKVTAGEKAALVASGMTDADVAAFEANRTAQYRQLNANVGAYTAAYSAGFHYTATDAEKKTLLKGSSWTERELGISVTPGLLKDITNTNPVDKSANVQGRRVILVAGKGIGETKVGVTVPYDVDPSCSSGPGCLTDEMKVALAAAERADIADTGSAIQIFRRRPLNFAAASELDVTVLAAPLGSSDDGKAFLASKEDARLGTVVVPGEARIKVRGSIVNVDDAFPAVQAGGLILEAANGGIGYVPDAGSGDVERPLRIQLTGGGALTARAADKVEINETAGDLLVDTVFSRKDASLVASGSILDAYADADLNVLAANLSLQSLTGSVGTLSNPLDVGVGSIDGRIQARTSIGSPIALNGPLGHSFNLGTIASGDAVRLSADVDMLIDGPVSAPGPVGLVSGGIMTMTPAGSVHSDAGSIRVDAGTLAMADGATVRSETGILRVVTAGDAVVTGLSTGNDGVAGMDGETHSVAVLSTAGNVRDGGDTRPDVIADTGNASLSLRAPMGHVGADNPLDVDVRRLDASARDAIQIAARSSVDVGAVEAGLEVGLAVTGSLSGSSVRSTAGPVSLAATGGVSLDSVQAAGSVGISSGGPVTGTLVRSTGGAVTVISAGAIDLTSARAAGDIRMDAMAGLTAGTVASSGGTVDLRAGADANVSDVAGQLGTTVTAGTSVVLGSAASAGGDVAVRAGDDATVATGSARGTLAVFSDRGDVTVGSVTADAVQLEAPGDVTGTAMHVGSALRLAGARVSGSAFGGGRAVGGYVTGFAGAAADTVALTFAGAGGFSLGNFWAAGASVTIPAGTFGAANFRIGDRGLFGNPETLVLVDQHDKSIQTADVQLYSEGAPFYLYLTGNRVRTNAFVIYRSPAHEVLTADGANASAAEQAGDALARIVPPPLPGGLPGSAGKTGELVDFTGLPVSTECGDDDPGCKE